MSNNIDIIIFEIKSIYFIAVNKEMTLPVHLNNNVYEFEHSVYRNEHQSMHQTNQFVPGNHAIMYRTSDTHFSYSNRQIKNPAETVTNEFIYSESTSVREDDTILQYNQPMTSTMDISLENTQSDAVFENTNTFDATSYVTQTRWKKRVLKSIRICMPKPRKRKHVRNEKKWIDNIAREARLSGTAGIGRKYKTILAKEKKPGCDGSCRLKCRERITEDDRDLAKDEYYKLKDPTKFWTCINKWVTNKSTDNLDKDFSDDEILSPDSKMPLKKYIYTLPTVDNGFLRVCRKMFLDTLGLLNNF